MERISVFDMFKIGVGPSSSHTLGPWKAATRALAEYIQRKGPLEAINKVEVHLYGSLALTGKGHATDIAVLMGLIGTAPETIDPAQVPQLLQNIDAAKSLMLNGLHPVPFSKKEHLHFHFGKTLPFHANGMTFKFFTPTGCHESTFYSVGGGFVVSGEQEFAETADTTQLPYPSDKATDMLTWHEQTGLEIDELIWANECYWRNEREIANGLMEIWHTMEQCIYRGCHADGELPGGLRVSRRAADMNRKLLGDVHYSSSEEWIGLIKKSSFDFDEVLRWITCFALAVNEENAAMGRVVTAPTNGAAGVIPAVVMYYFCFKNRQATDRDIIKFLLVAGEVGSYFKKGATISAAMGGCQAEIGVSSAMAAAGLARCLGGDTAQCLMAAEIAMEHHLGLTCDPIGGLVQVPCIERNTMGAIKAITAAKIALASDPKKAKVPLDKVIATMWEIAQNMDERYKETSRGGLAANIPVNVPEC